MKNWHPRDHLDVKWRLQGQPWDLKRWTNRHPWPLKLAQGPLKVHFWPPARAFSSFGTPKHRFWEPGGASASILEAPVYQFRDISHHTQRGLMQTSHTLSRAELGGKQIRWSTNWWCLNCTWKIRQIIPTLFTAFFLALWVLLESSSDDSEVLWYSKNGSFADSKTPLCY